MLRLLLLVSFCSFSVSLSISSKNALKQLRDMRLEGVELLESISSPEQMDLVETILDREEEEEETNRVNTEPVLITATDLDDNSINILRRLRELKEEEKRILEDLKTKEEMKKISVNLLREEIKLLEEISNRKTVKTEELQKRK